MTGQEAIAYIHSFQWQRHAPGLDRIRALLTRHREPPAWHPLPQEEDKEDPS